MKLFSIALSAMLVCGSFAASSRIFKRAVGSYEEPQGDIDGLTSGSDSNGDGFSDSSNGQSSQDQSSLSLGSGSDSNMDGDSDSSDGQSSGSGGSIASEASGSDTNNDGNSDSSALPGNISGGSFSDQVEDSGSDTDGDGNSDSSKIEDGDSDLENSSFEDSESIDEKGSGSDSDGDGNSDSSAEGGKINRLDGPTIERFFTGELDKRVVSPALRKVIESRISKLNGAPQSVCFSMALMTVAVVGRFIA